MKTCGALLLGIVIGVAFATAVPLFAESGWFYNSDGTQGVIHDNGGSGWTYDSKGNFGVYHGITPETNVLPYTSKSPC